MVRHTLLSILAIPLYVSVAQADLHIQPARVVDLTPSGFSLVWVASAPSKPRVEIYADAGGTVDITDQLELTKLPLRGGNPEAIDPYAHRQSISAMRAYLLAHGLMKVEVAGTRPNTSYCYRVFSETDGDTAVWPMDGCALARTPVHNELLSSAVQLLVTLSESDATGGLVTAGVDGGSMVSAFAGDGVGGHQAYLNLGNLFGPDGAALALHNPPHNPVNVVLEVTRGWGETTSVVVPIDMPDGFTVSHVATISLDRPLTARFDPEALMHQQPKATEVELVLGNATEAQAVEVVFHSDPPDLVIDAANLPTALEAGVEHRSVVTLTPAGPGTFTVTATITPERGPAVRTLLLAEFLDPARAPRIVGIRTEPNATEGTPFIVTVEVADIDDDPASLVYQVDRDRDGIYDEADNAGVWSFEFADDGEFPIAIAVTDPDGGRDEQVLLLQVANLPPRLESIPPTEATEGTEYTYVIAAEDPGDDLLTATVRQPAGATVDNEGILRWTPTFNDARSSPVVFTLNVTDEDGGEATQVWSVEVSLLDDDGDGVPDTCEQRHGLSGPGDEDGDGRSNREECLRGTSPTVDGRPRAPMLVGPIDCENVLVDAVFEIESTGDPDGDPVSFTYVVLLDDPQVDNPDNLEVFRSSANGGALTWTPNEPLPVGTYAWRARGHDGAGFGLWSEVSWFVINGAYADGSCFEDRDGDGFDDRSDNCPDVSNTPQDDLDGDLMGDVCDPDDDGDGAEDALDNCPQMPNAGQEDLDDDQVGDVCDSDRDADGVDNNDDNCPNTANADQPDADGDLTGDACDRDRDGDGTDNEPDNCPTTANAGQVNSDSDAMGDACDDCPHDPVNDADADGLCGDVDNCPALANPDQTDENGDGFGDACRPIDVEIPGSANVDPTAQIGNGTVIGEEAEIGQDVIISADVDIERGVTVGDGAELGAGVRVGADVVIGENSFVSAGVALADHAEIGAGAELEEDVRIGMGATIGDGSRIGARSHIQWDAVVDDDVDVGVDVTVEPNAEIGVNAVVGDSVIVAHGAEIGENAEVGAGVEMMPEAEIGASAVLAEDVVLQPHADLGDNVQVGAGSTVGSRSVVGNGVEMGASVTVGEHTQIGDDVIIGDNTQIAGSAQIGDGARLGHGVEVGSSNVGPGADVADDVIISNNCDIEADVVIESDVVIADNVRVGQGVTVGAGTAVSSDVEIGAGTEVGAGCEINPGVTLADNVYISADVVIEDNNDIGEGTSIGAGTRLWPGSEAGDEVTIGAGCKIGSNVSIGNRTVLGADCQLWQTVRVGNDNVFGYRPIIRENATVSNGGSFGDHVTMYKRVFVGDTNTWGNNVFVDRFSTTGDNVTIINNAYVPRYTNLAAGETFP